jgi:hypothetical protein
MNEIFLATLGHDLAAIWGLRVVEVARQVVVEGGHLLRANIHKPEEPRIPLPGKRMRFSEEVHVSL